VLAVVAITIIGIPLSVIGFLLFLLTAWVGAVYGRIAVGEWLLSLAGVTNRWLALLVGLVVVAIGVRVPVVGGLVEFLVFLLGFGALAATLYRGYRRRDRDLPGGAEYEEEGEESEGGPRPA
jgi:hypothetical protein